MRHTTRVFARAQDEEARMSAIGRAGSIPDPTTSADDATTPDAPPATPAAPDRTVPPSRPVIGAPAGFSIDAGQGTPVGTLGDGTQVSLDPASGTFTATLPDGSTLDGTAALYKAAECYADGQTGFLAQLDADGRAALAGTLGAAISQARTPDSPQDPPSTADGQARSGAATLTLALARSLPDSDPLKAQLVSSYVTQMGQEPLRGLAASMQLNLGDATKQGQVALSADQQATLAATVERTLPSAPPYAKWFANGKQDLHIHQYIHPEFYDAMRSGYDALGFQVTKDNGDGNVTLTKTFTGKDGTPMPVTVDITKTFAEDKRPERRLFNDMNDPNVQMEMYTGHSNLGGNVLGALASGPGMQQGDKWVIDWMCRGKQVLADVYNKYPDAAYTTTTDPAYVIQSDKFLNAMLQGVANRENYDQIWGDLQSSGFSETGMFMKPNDPRILGVRSLDDSGRVDVSAITGTDPLYKVGLSQVGDTAPFLAPADAPAAPEDLPGDKVFQGVNFMNTLLTYHHETSEYPHGNDGRLPPAEDHIVAGGWYQSDSDEICKFTKKDVNGETYYEVQVNSKYATQDIHALGAAICYETNKFLSVDKNGAYTEQDKMRGGLMAADYLAYMSDTYEQADGIIKAMQGKYGFNDQFTWTNAIHAINADNSGYCSPDAEKDLKASIGSADPAIG
jgi:hypothetical protein